MRFHHYSEYALIIVPIVLLLVWLFNSHRMGRFRKEPKWVLPLALGGVLLLVLAVLWLGLGT